MNPWVGTGLILLTGVLVVAFCIYMARKSRRDFFEKHGRYPNADDYADEGSWP